MIHQFMEAYGWGFDEAMSRTMPQIILLGHASQVTHERMVNRTDANKKKRAEEDTNPVVFKNKVLEELTTDEWMLYYGGMGG